MAGFINFSIRSINMDFLKKLFSRKNIKEFVKVWVVSLGVVVGLEVLSQIVVVPMGVLLWVVLIGFYYRFMR